MLAVLLHKKYKAKLSRMEVECLMGMLFWYIKEQEESVEHSLAELANIQRAVKLGQRLHQRLINIERGSFKITFNLQEATTLEVVLGRMDWDQLGAFERTIAYKINELLTR